MPRTWLAPRLPQNLPGLNKFLNSSRSGQPPGLQGTSVVSAAVESLGGSNTATGNPIVKFLKLFAREHVVLLGFRSPPRHKEMLADSPFIRQDWPSAATKKTRRAASSSVREKDCATSLRPYSRLDSVPQFRPRSTDNRPELAGSLHSDHALSKE
jgi:hypothetical protein